MGTPRKNMDGSLAAVADPNDVGYKRSAELHPDRWRWDDKTKQWEHRDDQGWKGQVDARQPGGSATPGYWLEGMFSGDRDIMGKNTAKGQAKDDAAALAKIAPPLEPDAADKLIAGANRDALLKTRTSRKSSFLTSGIK